MILPKKEEPIIPEEPKLEIETPKEEAKEEVKNPETNSFISIVLSSILLISTIVLFIMFKVTKKYKKNIN